jgi:U6 snRNA-associated Sm-like protein LSm5
LILYSFNSEITAEGRRITRLDQILLNGNNIAIVSANSSILLLWIIINKSFDLLVPGGSPDPE